MCYNILVIRRQVFISIVKMLISSEANPSFGITDYK